LEAGRLDEPGLLPVLTPFASVPTTWTPFARVWVWSRPP
jgi:hypothetical protein